MKVDLDMGSLLDSDVLFTGNQKHMVNNKVKEYITTLAQNEHKVFLLDSFWSEEKYQKFIYSRYRDEIERRYHIKLSVQDFLEKDNIITYMEEKGINILKVKSVKGYMSAAELFPVIVSRIDQDLSAGKKAHVLINDFVLEQLSGWEFNNLYHKLKSEQLKFIFVSIDQPVVNAFWQVIDESIIIK